MQTETRMEKKNKSAMSNKKQFSKFSMENRKLAKFLSKQHSINDIYDLPPAKKINTNKTCVYVNFECNFV